MWMALVKLLTLFPSRLILWRDAYLRLLDKVFLKDPLRP